MPSAAFGAPRVFSKESLLVLVPGSAPLPTCCQIDEQIPWRAKSRPIRLRGLAGRGRTDNRTSTGHHLAREHVATPQISWVLSIGSPSEGMILRWVG